MLMFGRRQLFRNEANAPAHAAAVIVGLQPGGVNTVDRKLLVAIFGIAGNADRADDLAVVAADQHAAAFGKNLLVARGDEIAHEDRTLDRALAHELRAAPERQRRIGFAIGHFEADHGGAVFLLEALYLAAGLDHDHADWPAIQFGAMCDDRIHNEIGLRHRDNTHV